MTEEPRLGHYDTVHALTEILQGINGKTPFYHLLDAFRDCVENRLMLLETSTSAEKNQLIERMTRVEELIDWICGEVVLAEMGIGLKFMPAKHTLPSQDELDYVNQLLQEAYPFSEE